jgi:periplasmic divalent cation tolerance protein
VNIVERVHSVYRWEGRVAADDEQLLLIKTSDARVDALRSELLRLHPYDVPEFVVLSIEGTSEAYGSWLLENLS